MRAVYITLLCIYLCAGKEEVNPRSVNLALETVLEFNNKDNSADIQVIDKVRAFLDKIKLVIDKNSRRKAFRRRLEDLKFSDFIQQTIAVLVTYKDDDLEDVIAIIDDEIRKTDYKDSKLHELLKKSCNLDNFKAATAKNIRNKLKTFANIIETAKFDERQKKFVDSVDSLYSGHSKEFKKFLENISHYKLKSTKSSKDFKTLIKDGVRNIIDYYKSLDNKTRRGLTLEIEAFFKDKKENYWQFKSSEDGNKRIQINGSKKNTKVTFETDEKTILAKPNKRRHDNIKKHSYKHDIEGTDAKYIQGSNITVNVKRDNGESVSKSPIKDILTYVTLYPEELITVRAKQRKTPKVPLRRLRDSENHSKYQKRKRQESDEKIKNTHTKLHKNNASKLGRKKLRRDFRKSVEDNSLDDENNIPMTTTTLTTTINYLKRINDLERELESVKARIKDIQAVKNDKLEFWKGTTKEAVKNNENIKLVTVKSNVTLNAKSTTKVKDTKLDFVTKTLVTGLPIAKLKTVNNTSEPVFKSRKAVNDTRVNEETKRFDDKSQISEEKHNYTDINNNIIVKDNEIDDYNIDNDKFVDEIDDSAIEFVKPYNNNTFTSQMDNLQKYVRKDDLNDKINLVRKKMLKDLSGMLIEKPQKDNNTINFPFEVNKPKDPLSELDDSLSL